VWPLLYRTNPPSYPQVKKVKEYMKDPQFTYDSLRTISIAGAGLLKWVLMTATAGSLSEGGSRSLCQLGCCYSTYPEALPDNGLWACAHLLFNTCP
jgi:hypothetical protein